MEEIINNKFNYLTPIKPVFLYRREWVWLCKCDCGNETNVRISKLKNGTTKSCGCFKKKNLIKKEGDKHESWKGYKKLSKSFYSRIKQSAFKRNITFEVTIEYLYDLFEKQKGLCNYTGQVLELPINVRQLRGENNEYIASLDRIDNSIGYIEGNLQWICKRVNYMKHTMKEEYFLDLIKTIYQYKFK